MPRYNAGNPLHMRLVSAVYLDGNEVSNKAFAVDTDEGWVEVYTRDEEGRMLLGDSGPLIERVHGEIRVELDPNFEPYVNLSIGK